MTSWNYVTGRSFKEAFIAADEEGRRALLARWRDLVEARSTASQVPLDAIPGNVLVDEDGELQLIDNEFHSDDPVEFVIERGLYWFAFGLARTTVPETWPGATTVRDVLDYLAGLLDLDLDDQRIERLVAAEARFQATVTTNYLGPEALASFATRLDEFLGQRLWDGPLGYRLHHRYDLEVKETARLREQVSGLQERIAAQTASIAELRERIRRLRGRLEKSKARLSHVRAKLDRAKGDLRAIRASRSYRLAAGLTNRTARLRRR
jgi:uncharacterized coiled-coil protein SlyX